MRLSSCSHPFSLLCKPGMEQLLDSPSSLLNFRLSCKFLGILASFLVEYLGMKHSDIPYSLIKLVLLLEAKGRRWLSLVWFFLFLFFFGTASLKSMKGPSPLLLLLLVLNSLDLSDVLWADQHFSYKTTRLSQSPSSQQFWRMMLVFGSFLEELGKDILSNPHSLHLDLHCTYPSEKYTLTFLWLATETFVAKFWKPSWEPTSVLQKF